jgi:hypothetical protein
MNEAQPSTEGAERESADAVFKRCIGTNSKIKPTMKIAAGTTIQMVGHHHRKLASLACSVASSVAITPAMATARANAPHACTGSTRLLNAHRIGESYRHQHIDTMSFASRGDGAALSSHPPSLKGRHRLARRNQIKASCTKSTKTLQQLRARPEQGDLCLHSVRQSEPFHPAFAQQVRRGRGGQG